MPSLRKITTHIPYQYGTKVRRHVVMILDQKFRSNIISFSSPHHTLRVFTPPKTTFLISFTAQRTGDESMWSFFGCVKEYLIEMLLLTLFFEKTDSDSRLRQHIMCGVNDFKLKTEQDSSNVLIISPSSIVLFTKCVVSTIYVCFSD